MIGKTVSHYMIHEKIGEGGMGVVYKAVDTKLNRIVALKFLPPELTRDPEAKTRFIREAQAASSLDHPNICTIHEIDETDDGRMFIVMAYYAGQTLKEKISHGPLNLEEAIHIASEIAQGLMKAHERGIVHRDIKPANVLITQDGVAKIVDFGLAKLRGQTKLTKEDTTLGTVSYMSPEQGRGEKVDHRTDIWSLGVILYEMITGRLPFRGDYEQAVIYAVLNEEPEPVTGLRTGVPMDLERIVTKALAKNPGDRYQHIDELLVDLKSLQKAPVPLPGIRRAPKLMSKTLMGTMTFIVIAVILIAGYLFIRPKHMEFHIKHTMPLTTAPGLEQDPAWSPEGTRLAYTSDESGNRDIWIRQIAAGQRINLTEGHMGYDGKPAWSPDGEWIAFVSERDGGGIFLMPTLGGIPKRVVSLSFAVSLFRLSSIPTLSWSPNGSELVYTVAGSLYTISSGGGTPSPVPLPPKGLILGYLEPAWSPDGKRIACTGILAAAISTSQIWSLHCHDNDPISITDGKHYDYNPVWSADGKQLYFISDRNGSHDVWWIPVSRKGKPTGPARPITTGVGIGAIALSSDGTRLAYTKMNDRSSICSIPIVADRLVTLDETMVHTSENNYIEQVAISPDKEWIAFDSNQRGNMDIWVMRKNGSERRQLTSDPAHDWLTQWSPDGGKILFHSMRTGNRDLFVMPVGGGTVTQLTNHPAEDLAAVWSPDGKMIGFLSNRAGNMDAWVMPSGGGEPRQLTVGEAQDFWLLWAPDGKQIVFSTNRTGYDELFVIPEKLFLRAEEKGNPVQLTHGMWSNISPLYWTEDGHTIFAYGVGGPFNQKTNLWAISVANGAARPLIDFGRSLKEPSHSLSSDGERIYFPLWERIGDLWMAELSIEE